MRGLREGRRAEGVLSPHRVFRRGVALIALLGVFIAMGCVGSTGGDLVDFGAVAAGPGRNDGEAYRFSTGRGFDVRLTKALLHVGAMYLNRSVPTSVSSDTSCTLQGTYVAEVPVGIDLDLLAFEETAFAEPGYGTTDQARTGEVWLMGDDPNSIGDSTVILDVAGEASKDGLTFPFTGSLTIGANRVVAPANPALPGSKPICKERVVSPIATDIVPRAGGTLVLRVDPAGMFANVDFTKLEAVGGGYRFRDDGTDQPSAALYAGLHSSQGVYSFEWR
jgi:hypothetical protein